MPLAGYAKVNGKVKRKVKRKLRKKPSHPMDSAIMASETSSQKGIEIRVLSLHAYK